MEKIVIDLEVKSNKGVKDVEKLNKEINNTNKEAKETNKTLDGLTGGAITKFKNFKGSISNVVKSFKSLRIAIIGTGIGALLIAVTSLGQAFTRSEEGQNKFAKLLGVIGSVTGNLLDLLADLGENIISVFENPKQAILNFVNLLKNNITNRFEGLLELIPKLGQAVSLLFEGKFSEAGKLAADSVGKVVLGVDSITESFNNATKSISNFTQEIIKEGKIAGQIADQRAKADKLERGLIVERAEADRKVAELREQAADKDKVSAKDRIIALEEAGKISEEITKKEIEAAKLRFESKVAENKLSKSTKEDLDEEANLKARLIQLETARLKQQKSITAEISGARKEEKARIDAEEKEQKAKDDEAEASKLEKAKSLTDLKKQIRDAEAVTEDERRALELIKVQEHYDKLIELAKAQGLSTEALEKSKANAVSKITEQKSNNEIKWEELTAEGKKAIVSKGLNDLSNILGKESAAGKAAAIASATISTFESANSSYKSLAGIPIIGPVLGAAAAGAAIVSGYKNVKAIASTKTPKGGGGSAPSLPSASSPSVSQPPSFNVVGSSGTNQLADAIGGQSQKPVKAYVVSNDVTTAQSMDRNIVEGASL